MMSAHSHRSNDTLFLACTRPVMIAGVTVEAMAFNIAITTSLFILLGSVAYASLGVAVHLLFRALVRHDHNMFRVLVAYLDLRSRTANIVFWGGASVSPLHGLPSRLKGRGLHHG
jgi:type IV secretion system protein VirB3